VRDREDSGVGMLIRKIDQEIVFRRACLSDLPHIIRLLKEDELGKERETDADDSCYTRAFEEISLDHNQFLMVLQKQEEIVGTCHLTAIPSLTFQGSRRMHIEAVRIDARYRGQSLGTQMLEAVLKIAQEQGCILIELTTHKSRIRAQRFYEQLGFKNTHMGMKLKIDDL
jgi:ribosomal protein S18 acetylase RimI-like enzyme